MVLRIEYGAHASLEITLLTKNHTTWSAKPMAPVLILFIVHRVGYISR